MRLLGKALTFDDVLLVPAYSQVLPRDTSLSTRLSRNIQLNLPLDRHVLVDDAETALARHLHRHLGLGDRIHGGGEQRDAQLDPPRHARAEVGILGVDQRVPRDQQHVVERERFLQDARRRWLHPLTSLLDDPHRPLL